MDEDFEEEVKKFFQEQQKRVERILNRFDDTIDLESIVYSEDLEEDIKESDELLLLIFLLYLPQAFRVGWDEVLKSLELDNEISSQDIADARRRSHFIIPQIQGTTLRAIRTHGERSNTLDALKEKIAVIFLGWQTHRANMIAQTETTLATRRGGDSIVQLALLQGKIEKHWYDQNDEKVCQLCRTNTNAGWIDARMDFPNGNYTHPRCRCYIRYRNIPLYAP